MALVLAWLCLLGQLASAQTFTVLHNFTGRADGAEPSVGLTMDPTGNLYGTTLYGGVVPEGAFGNGLRNRI